MSGLTELSVQEILNRCFDENNNRLRTDIRDITVTDTTVGLSIRQNGAAPALKLINDNFYGLEVADVENTGRFGALKYNGGSFMINNDFSAGEIDITGGIDLVPWSATSFVRFYAAAAVLKTLVAQVTPTAMDMQAGMRFGLGGWSTNPAAAVEGQIGYNLTLNKAVVYSGAAWETITSAA